LTPPKLVAYSEFNNGLYKGSIMARYNHRSLARLANLALALILVLSACQKTTDPTLSSDKAITAFSFASPAATGTIDENAKTISLNLPTGTKVTALVASFTASTGASVSVGGTAQVSGTTANDFSKSVTYTVTAADASTANYVVTVTVAASSEKAITAFSFASPAATGTISESAKTISVVVPFKTDVTNLVASFTASTGASVSVGGTPQVSGTTANDFTKSVTYTVTAADGTKTNYTVSLAKTMTVGVSGTTVSGWQSACTASIQAEAKARGYTVDNVVGDDTQPTQIAALRSFIAKKVDLIGFDPISASGWDTVLGEAKAAGIPVILYNAGLSSSSSLWATRITSDYSIEGGKAGAWVRDSSGIAAASLKIAELAGVAGSAAATERASGFRSVISPSAIVHSVDCSYSKDTAKAQTAAWLAGGNPDHINLIFAHNDGMALGAIEAIKEASLNPGVDIKVVSFDAIKEGLQAILAGSLNCSVQCSPLVGPKFLDAAEKILKGTTVATPIYVDEVVYTSANVTQALIDSWTY
jgi:galactofuranose transport system substrate-binding protein